METRSFLQERQARPISEWERLRAEEIRQARIIFAERQRKRMVLATFGRLYRELRLHEGRHKRGILPPPALVRILVQFEAARARVTPEAMFGPARTRAVSHARWRVYYRLYRYGYSLISIGHAMNKDHTTVLNGLQRLQELRRAA